MPDSFLVEDTPPPPVPPTSAVPARPTSAVPASNAVPIGTAAPASSAAPTGAAPTNAVPITDNLADGVRRAARATAGRVALRHGQSTVTWAELDRWVDAIAHRLVPYLSAGPHVRHPPRIAIRFADPLSFAASYFACLRAGAVAVPLDLRLPASLLAAVLRDCAAAAMLSDVEGGRVASIDHTPPAPTAQVVAVPARGGGEELAVLIYPPSLAASGDVAPAAMLPHRALIANHEQLARVEPPIMRGDDIVLLAAPLPGAYGLNCGLGALAYHGASGVLALDGDPAVTCALVSRYRVTTVVGVPSLYARWAALPGLDDMLRTVQVAACGAPVDRALAAAFTAASGHRIFVGYGVAEASPVLTSTLVGAGAYASVGPAADTSRPIGRPLPGVQLRLLTDDGTVVGVPDDGGSWDSGPRGGHFTAAGEIMVRGRNLFTGYWPAGGGGPDADGWWATGDRAYADIDGLLYLAPRTAAP